MWGVTCTGRNRPRCRRTMSSSACSVLLWGVSSSGRGSICPAGGTTESRLGTPGGTAPLVEYSPTSPLTNHDCPFCRSLLINRLLHVITPMKHHCTLALRNAVCRPLPENCRRKRGKGHRTALLQA